jgi:hypothetical protein
MSLPYINLPYELFNVEKDLTGRIAQVTSWFRPITYETPQFRVKLTNEQWADFVSSAEMKTLYTFYVKASVEKIKPSDGGTYENWMQLANVLFFVEMK